MTHLLAIVGLGLACAGWYLVQRWTGALDTYNGNDEAAGCGTCTVDDCGQRPDPLDPSPNL